MRFSLVIPAYNYGHVVERAVESACSQPGDDYEVLVIDDGATDNTPEVLAGLTDKHANLQVIRQYNAGLAAVRNRGLAESRGDYLIFLDADDAFEPGALAAFRSAAESHPDAGLLIAPTISIFPDGREQVGKPPVIATQAEQRFLDFLYKRLSIANGAVAMHRKVFERVRYNPALRQTEDIPVFAQCLASADAIALSRPTTRIFKHDGSMRHDVETALSLGMTLVDEVFDPQRLPAGLMVHRDGYAARRALSVFRLCYRARRYSDARVYFRRALHLDWRACLRKPKYVVKYLNCLLRG